MKTNERRRSRILISTKTVQADICLKTFVIYVARETRNFGLLGPSRSLMSES
jgi:hypothetical protein